MDVNLWTDADHARRYLDNGDLWQWRETAYRELEAWIPTDARRVLDLGCGDGEVTARVRTRAPGSTARAVDFSSEMLGRARDRFRQDDAVEVSHHDLDHPLPPEGGPFDLVVSAFAIHHVHDDRKQALYAEVFGLLSPGGSFLNLEHVASATPELHEAFLVAIGTDLSKDDPSNKLAPVETQLAWLRELGFEQADCHYKWRELALLAGRRPR